MPLAERDGNSDFHFDQTSRIASGTASSQLIPSSLTLCMRIFLFTVVGACKLLVVVIALFQNLKFSFYQLWPAIQLETTPNHDRLGSSTRKITKIYRYKYKLSTRLQSLLLPQAWEVCFCLSEHRTWWNYLWRGTRWVLIALFLWQKKLRLKFSLYFSNGVRK